MLPPSHLFTLRMWPEDMGQGRIEWRGQVRHVTSGQTYNFRDWATLLEHMCDLIAAAEATMAPQDQGVHEARWGARPRGH